METMGGSSHRDDGREGHHMETMGGSSHRDDGREGHHTEMMEGRAITQRQDGSRTDYTLTCSFSLCQVIVIYNGNQIEPHHLLVVCPHTIHKGPCHVISPTFECAHTHTNTHTHTHTPHTHMHAHHTRARTHQMTGVPITRWLLSRVPHSSHYLTAEGSNQGLP